MTDHLANLRQQVAGMTAEQRETFFAERAAARQAEENAKKLQKMLDVAAAFRGSGTDGYRLAWPTGMHSALKYSTEMLEADLLAYEADPVENDLGIMTHPRQARELLRLDTPARRQRADQEAQTMGNLQGGIHSQNISRAVSALLDMIENGTEDQEMYAERVAREHREREADLRKTHPGAIYHHPAMRRA